MQELVVCDVWKKFRELSGVLVRKQSLSLKQQGNIYQCCVRPVFCIIVKCGTLLLWVRQGCVGWSII